MGAAVQCHCKENSCGCEGDEDMPHLASRVDGHLEEMCHLPVQVPSVPSQEFRGRPQRRAIASQSCLEDHCAKAASRLMLDEMALLAPTLRRPPEEESEDRKAKMVSHQRPHRSEEGTGRGATAAVARSAPEGTLNVQGASGGRLASASQSALLPSRLASYASTACSTSDMRSSVMGPLSRQASWMASPSFSSPRVTLRLAPSSSSSSFREVSTYRHASAPSKIAATPPPTASRSVTWEDSSPWATVLQVKRFISNAIIQASPIQEVNEAQEEASRNAEGVELNDEAASDNGGGDSGVEVVDPMLLTMSSRLGPATGLQDPTGENPQEPRAGDVINGGSMLAKPQLQEQLLAAGQSYGPGPAFGPLPPSRQSSGMRPPVSRESSGIPLSGDGALAARQTSTGRQVSSGRLRSSDQVLRQTSARVATVSEEP